MSKFPRVFIKAAAATKVDNVPSKLKDMSVRSNAVISSLLTQSKLSSKDISMVIVGNMLSPVIQHQSQLASFVCSKYNPPLLNVDTLTIDAACGSGGAALRAGLMAIGSGMHKNVIVLGIEQMILDTNEALYGAPSTDKAAKEQLTKGLAQASDWQHEGGGPNQETFVSLNDKVMTEYIRRFSGKPGFDREDFFYFSENSHKNAATNEYALFRKPIEKVGYAKSTQLGENVRLLDCCPVCNGAAGLLLSSEGVKGLDAVIVGNDSKVDNINLSTRDDVLAFAALKYSAQKCFEQAGIKKEELDVYEAHDAYSIMSARSLEVLGYVGDGEALKFAKSGGISLTGQLPLSTFGGLKARGHPVGASGVYQLFEAVRQVKGEAGRNQVKREGGRFPKYVMASTFGGAATTIISTIISV